MRKAADLYPGTAKTDRKDATPTRNRLRGILPIAHDAEVSRVIAGYRSELETAIYRGIRVQFPELAESEVRCRCRAITGLIIGAFAIARIDAAAAARSIATAQALLRSIN